MDRESTLLAEPEIFNDFIENGYKDIRRYIAALEAHLNGLPTLAKGDKAIARLVQPATALPDPHGVVSAVDAASAPWGNLPGCTISAHIGVKYSMHVEQKSNHASYVAMSSEAGQRFSSLARINLESQLVSEATENECVMWDGSLGATYWELGKASMFAYPDQVKSNEPLERDPQAGEVEQLLLQTTDFLQKAISHDLLLMVPKEAMSRGSLKKFEKEFSFRGHSLPEILIADALCPVDAIFNLHRPYAHGPFASAFLESKWDFLGPKDAQKRKDLRRFFKGVVSCTYKAHEGARPFRLEWFEPKYADSKSAVDERVTLSDRGRRFLSTFKDQTASPHVIEPTPLLIADRTAKQVKHFVSMCSTMAMDGPVDGVFVTGKYFHESRQ